MHTIAARAFDPAGAALATAALEALDAERPVRVPLTSILGVDLSADQAGDSPAARGSPGGETNRRTPLRTPDLLDDVEVVERRLAVQEAGPPLVCGFRLRQFGDLGGVVLGGELQQLPEVIGAVVIGCDDGHPQGALTAAGVQPGIEGPPDLVGLVFGVELDELNVWHTSRSTPEPRQAPGSRVPGQPVHRASAWRLNRRQPLTC